MVPGIVPVLHAVFSHQGNPPKLLAQVTAPTLVVGEEEYGGDTSAREAQQAIPNARLATIPRAGHSVLAEQPDVGTKAIAGFIREVEET
jgi:pimeloyl-ACP methyl ester carboxylesterase